MERVSASILWPDWAALMARDRVFLFSLNGGMVSPLALARTDLQRMRLTAETFENCFPKVIGPLQFRPGLNYNGQTNGIAKNIPFIFSVDDTALVELSDFAMRVIVNGAPVTRPAVTTTIPNGDFNSAAGWTITTSGGATADINTTLAGSLFMRNTARGGGSVVKQGFAIANVGVEHAVNVVIERGPVRFRMGSTDGGSEYIGEFDLGAGTHSLVFTPTSATAYVQFSSKSETNVFVSSVQIEGSGILQLGTPWPNTEIFNVRNDQSGDVIFAVNQKYPPYRIERRGPRSWSVVQYKFKDGPFRGKTAEISLTPSTRLGNGFLTASAPFFLAGHIGCLFEMTHTQTTADVSLSGNDQYSDVLRISGKNEGTVRDFTYAVSGTWVGKVTVQTSPDSEDGPWNNHATISVNQAPITLKLGVDNSILFVRVGFQAGDYTSGTAVVALAQPGGGGSGVVRITAISSPTVAFYEVVSRLHFTGATENWQEGKYSTLRGWPSAVALFDGRLWLAGADQVSGSYSDDFSNFDVNEVGDSGPIIRSVATGPVNKVQWMLGLSRLIIGTSGAESVMRSSSFDEPLTPSNNSIKDASTYGSANVQAVKIDRSGVFVSRSGKRAYDVSFSVDAQDYSSSEITRYNPTILEGVCKVIAVQRQPDTRIWFVLNDGTCAVLTHEKSEDVISWARFTTDGFIEDVCVLPNADSDDVTLIVRRTIAGVDYRYREKLAYESQASGGLETYMSDSFVAQSISATNLVSGLSHLNGKSVVVWMNGNPLLDANDDPALFVVASGAITIPAVSTGRVICGLPYTGYWKSTKLAYAAQTGTAMSQRKIATSVAPILYMTHNQAIRFGQDFERMDPLPRSLKGLDVGVSAMLDDYDYDAFALPGSWSNDSRLCMKFRSPMPATVLGVGIGMESHERA
jgi:hypothetical protein